MSQPEEPGPPPLRRLSLEDDHFHDQCGLFGIFGHPEAAHLAYMGLYALQHRGQESAGIACGDGKRLRLENGMGLVNDVFTPSRLEALPGDRGLIFVRFRNGAFGTVVSTAYRHGAPKHLTELTCTGGALNIEYSAGVVIGKGEKWTSIPDSGSEAWMHEALVHEWRAFVRAIEEDTEEPVPSTFARHIMEVVFAAEQSSRQRTEIAPGDGGAARAQRSGAVMSEQGKASGSGSTRSLRRALVRLVTSQPGLVTLSLLGFLAAWEPFVVVFGIRAYILPRPTEIAVGIVKYMGSLLKASSYTVRSMVVGYVIAAVLGLLLALPIAFSRTMQRTIYPLLVVSQLVPKVALAPIFVIWFGFGLLPKITIVFLLSFFPVLLNSVVALKSIDPEIIYLARSTGSYPKRLCNSLPPKAAKRL